MGFGRISTRDSVGPSSIVTICAFRVDERISFPTRCSIRNSWNTAGAALKAVRNGDASSALTQSQKPEGSLRSGRALCFSKPIRQTVISWARGKSMQPLRSLFLSPWPQ